MPLAEAGEFSGRFAENASQACFEIVRLQPHRNCGPKRIAAFGAED